MANNEIASVALGVRGRHWLAKHISFTYARLAFSASRGAIVSGQVNSGSSDQSNRSPAPCSSPLRTFKKESHVLVRHAIRYL